MSRARGFVILFGRWDCLRVHCGQCFCEYGHILKTKKDLPRCRKGKVPQVVHVQAALRPFGFLEPISALYLSDFAEMCPLGFRLKSGSGLASDSKATVQGASSRLGTCPSQWSIFWWLEVRYLHFRISYHCFRVFLLFFILFIKLPLLFFPFHQCMLSISSSILFLASIISHSSGKETVLSRSLFLSALQLAVESVTGFKRWQKWRQPFSQHSNNAFIIETRN